MSESFSGGRGGVKDRAPSPACVGSSDKQKLHGGGVQAMCLAAETFCDVYTADGFFALRCERLLASCSYTFLQGPRRVVQRCGHDNT